MHARATSRTRGSQSAIRRGVKPRLTRLRIGPWRGRPSAISWRVVASTSSASGSACASENMRCIAAGSRCRSTPGATPIIKVRIASEEKRSASRGTVRTSS